MSVEVPFRLAGGGCPLLLIPVHVNGAGPFAFILDTGANLSLLAPGLAQRLEVPVSGSKEALGAGGSITVSLGEVRSLAVGDAIRENVQIAITRELDRIAAAIGTGVDGDLGYNYLKNFILTIDYGKRTVEFTPPASQPPPAPTPDSVEQPFTLASPARPLLVVPVQVNGKGPFWFALDTGASQTVITPALARKLGVGTANGPDILGAGGAAEAGVAVLDSLGVAGAVQRRRTVIISGFVEAIHQKIGAHLDGILGYDFLKNFQVSIDYIRQVLRLVPLSDPSGTASLGFARK